MCICCYGFTSPFCIGFSHTDLAFEGFLWLIRIRCVNISLLIISVTILCGVRGCDGDDIDDSNGRWYEEWSWWLSIEFPWSLIMVGIWHCNIWAPCFDDRFPPRLKKPSGLMTIMIMSQHMMTVSGEIGRNRNYWNRILEIRRIWSNPSVNRTRNSQFFHSGLWLMEGLKDIKSFFRDECSHFHTLFLLGGFTSSASTFIDNPCKPKQELSIVFS